MTTSFGQFVIGPAGSGKSTYCSVMQEYADTVRREVKVCNLDPAAETFKYRCDIDIRDLISLEDVMEEMKYGPNGGLVYCMEFLLENLDWLETELSDFADDAYILFDCPGQIELYTHLDVMNKIVNKIKGIGFTNLCAVFLADSSQCAVSPHKFISNAFVSLSTMI